MSLVTVEMVEERSCPDCWSGTNVPCVPIRNVAGSKELYDLDRMYHASRRYGTGQR
jgi:hypothetical protein